MSRLMETARAQEEQRLAAARLQSRVRERTHVEGLERQIRTSYHGLEGYPKAETCPVRFLGSKREPLPRRRSRGGLAAFGNEIYWSEYHKVYRFDVDGVTVRVFHSANHGSAPLISPAVRCKNCGRETSPDECEAFFTGGNLVDRIGRAERQTWTCAHCTTQVPRECPTCGRRAQ